MFENAKFPTEVKWLGALKFIVGAPLKQTGSSVAANCRRCSIKRVVRAGVSLKYVCVRVSLGGNNDRATQNAHPRLNMPSTWMSSRLLISSTDRCCDIDVSDLCKSTPYVYYSLP